MVYDRLGARELNRRKVTFRLFHPHRTRCPRDCDGCVWPELAEVRAVGTFQPKAWDVRSAPVLKAVPAQGAAAGALATRGYLYETEVDIDRDDFFDYRYHLVFKDGSERQISDPCSRYEGDGDGNSGFVIGGRWLARDPQHPRPDEVVVHPIRRRLPYQDLVIYEVNLDDFTALYRGNTSPLNAVKQRLTTVRDLGFNAIELMPLVGCSTHGFTWGYDPTQYFSIAYRYAHQPDAPLDRLTVLADVVNACHELDLHVLMDGVFNHAKADPPWQKVPGLTRDADWCPGYGYYWMWQVPPDSPFVGNYADAAYIRDLEYGHGCTLDFALDVCRSWIDTFRIDGIRLDNTKGLYSASDRTHGLPALLSELRQHTRTQGVENFALILEHEWDYSSIYVTNVVGATSCWYDKFRARAMECLEHRKVEPDFMRVLDSGRDFQAGAFPTIYLENHDHRAFILKASGDRGEWWRMQPYLIALFTCSGAVLVHNGQEYGNSYDMPESGDGRVVPRPIDWNAIGDGVGTSVSALLKQLITLRTAHPALRTHEFHPRAWDERSQRRDAQGFGLDVDAQVAVFHRWGPDAQGKLERLYVVLNFSDDPAGRDVRVTVATPGTWRDLLSGDTFSTRGPENALTVHVGRCWGRVLG